MPEPLGIVGYADRLSVCPGEGIRFMVSCAADAYDAAIVRLIHGDESPRGPGFKEVLVAELARVPGRRQPLLPGSAMVVPTPPALDGSAAWTVMAWIWPTNRGRRQGLIGRWRPGAGGARLGLLEDGQLAFAIDDGTVEWTLRAGPPPRLREWYLVAATWDPSRAEATVAQLPQRTWPEDPTSTAATATAPVAPPAVPTDVPLVIAASSIGVDRAVVEAYDGKVAAPAVIGRAVSPGDLGAVARAGAVGDEPLLAAWDFTPGAGRVVPDRSGGSHHGTLHNGPELGATSHGWDSSASDPRLAPDHHAAIHFHADDLEDAGWSADVEYLVPERLPSGVYAARLRTGEHEDHVPFVVRPLSGRPTARVALLLPTLTYIAYGNDHNDEQAPEHRHWKLPTTARYADTATWAAAHEYIRRNRLLSLYDTHADGSGVTLSSRLRPMLNLRPRFRFRQLSAPARFPADLYIVDWLEAHGHAHDVITDEDLHAEGVDLVRPYDVLITGTHPEYATREMLDALLQYRDGGGRIAYLGGNGFYWVTSIDPERPHVIEVRRAGGTGPFEVPPGESHHGTTGARGGLWRDRGRAPQLLVGVGFSASGSDVGTGYRRQPASHDERFSWIFDGVDGDRFGDVPSLVLGSGAAGYEIDRADVTLGTPPDAVVIASSEGHPATYRPAVEELDLAVDWPLCDEATPPTGIHPTVRSDLVYLDRGRAGAVFATGSIAWAACLSANGYDNAVSRITDNVLRRWLATPRGPRRD